MVRALLSVFDKTGIVDLAVQLHKLDIDLVSSGGTAREIAAADIPVTDVADLTGYPAILGHRVVTLHPHIHGGILADRRDPSHLTDLENHQIDLIDIVVGNLYPFASDPSIDMIDIGGPTLLRAAAKNYEYVTVIVDTNDYDEVLSELVMAGTTSLGLRRRLARKAFAHTAAYDAQIVNWIDSEHGAYADTLPTSMHFSLERAQDLKYGENPHQQGARYRVSGTPTWWDDVEQLSGSEVGYLNLFDADAAWHLVHDFDRRPACAIIKHANPSGVAVADNLATAYSQALACDEMSAFGGIVALNRPIDEATAAAIEAGPQADLIIAPGYDDGVVERLKARRANTRILLAPKPESQPLAIRQLSAGFLVQTEASVAPNRDGWSVVTSRQPSATELDDAEFAWRVCARVSSNAIVLAKDGVAWGIGAGQQNRVQSAAIAAGKADRRAADGACASDAFYPFPDGVEAAADAGVAVVIQPGGSVNDQAVIEAADARGIAMVFTGERQFKH